MSTKAKKDVKQNKNPRQTGAQSEMASTSSNDATANLGLILKELRDFRRDNKTQLEDIKEEITKTNTLRRLKSEL